MMLSPTTVLAVAAAAGLANAAQPGAVQPVEAPMRSLTWGQINFLHTTDTHGWLGGHLLEPQYSADWGDYISFSHHMRNKADSRGSDLLIIDTGDRVEGNGLYDASSPKGLFQYGIYAEQDVDILCTGNHELYQPYSIEREHNTTVPNFKDNYVASNLDHVDLETGERSPMAQRFRRFKTKNQNLDIIAFGFIFDFTGNANNSVVQRVEDTVKEDWFLDVIKEKPDLFVVTGHIGLRMEEFEIIFKAMRKENWHTPIAFFGGHAHVRDTRKFDSLSFAMASGRYMETIGWMSIDGIKRSEDDTSIEATPSFSRKYLDNNLYGMYHHTGLNESTFPTDKGTRVSKAIHRARQALDLDYQFGCAPQSYWMSRKPYPHKDNIYSLITDEVFPGVVINEKRKDKARIALINTGGIRFDIFQGPFTRDSTYIVSPFVSGFRYVPDVPWKVAKKVNDLLNSGGRIFSATGLDTKFMANPDQMEPIVQRVEENPHLELRSVQEPLGKSQPDLIGGYTTKDDVGTDGDDTVHEKLEFHAQPNSIQSEIAFPADGSDPETVDVVFIDFIQPWVIPALKFSGGDYTDDDVKQYMEGTFTYKFSQWISENWKGEC
ncbi:ser Thr protein phosphatase family [Geosmithia morbida]|uniref:Ser Thr protein phosphatase family n=1 Tax=Geosmithia morbida TaxID=1094350 RepID=A0A9P4YVN1_9HYPO|nr:ser Thr protein phosphatase family [Geosmithia morbida]KAF4122875.1 ser Thr protein phosphatase family [Geosmithia morbida]